MFGPLLQAALAVAYAVISIRLMYTALRGRGIVRLMRWVGAAVTLGWAAFYALAVTDFHLDLLTIEAMAAIARGIQTLTVSLFALWAFTMDEESWCKKKLRELGDVYADVG